MLLETRSRTVAPSRDLRWQQGWGGVERQPAHREAVRLTCSASPGGELSNLIPPVLLKIIALHTADGLGCLAANHDHDLQKDKWTLAGSPQHPDSWVINPCYVHMLTAQGPWMI